MKIDQSTILRKGFSTELTHECSEFIANLKRTGSMEEFISKLDSMTEWSSVLGKTEMGRWTDILNDCDEILEAATKSDETGTLAIDADEKLHHPVISIMRFTSLLFENSFSRSVYSSMERLLRLLDSRNMLIVVQVLRLLHIISKSSRYITQHVQHTEKRVLYMKLTANIECWGGKLRNIKMSDFCVENPENWDLSAISFRTNSGVENFSVDLYTKRLSDSAYEVEESEKILAIAKLKLAYNLVDNTSRYFCIMSRLISISALFYSRCLLDEWRINCLINDDLIEQICALLQLPMGSTYNPGLDGVKTEAMKTITSIVFLDKPRKIHLVVDCLGLNSYHGFTATLVRTCVDRLKSGAISETNSEFSVNFVTALFSMVYHIAGIDYGGESLISCSMIGALLEVMKSCSFPDSQISFVTRAVRIIDLLTGFDVTEFNSNDGMTAIVERFCHEVEVCKQHMSSNAADANGSVVCHQQRVALMKSLLNFLKRAVVDTNYATQVRRIMEGDLPTAITHIVENPQYYGSSLLHCAIHLTTSFIYQEPTQLTFLQDKGLTDALLKSLFNEKFPLSRDLVTGLPSICSALCLNERGLKAFNEHSPLERIFRIIFSTRFVSSLRKRKNELLEVATGLGTAFDELLRHQPTLRKDLIHAFVKVLDDILAYGSNADGKKCVVSWNIGKTGPIDDDHARRSESTPRDQETGDEEYVEPNRHRGLGVTFAQPVDQSSFQLCFEQDGGSVLPLGDYAGIIGSLLEAVLTNRAAQENSLLILECGVPQKLVKILTFGKPYPAIQQSSYLQNLANIIRHLLSQSNKVDAFDVLVSSVSDQLQSYERCKCPEDASSRERMYLLTRMSSLVFVVSNFMKTSLSNVHDTRSLLLNYFAGNETGQAFIRRLFSVYRDLNWDMLFLNSQQQQNQASNPPSTSLTENRPSDATSANTQSPASVTAAETSAASPMDTGTSETGTSKSTKKSGEHSLERSVHSMVSRSLKQVSEVIIWLGKTFCNSITRLRRGFDSSAVRDSHKVAEMLFSGVVQLFQLNDDMTANWSGMYIYQVLSILKKMVFDEYQGHLIMLPFFYKSGCHKAFFDQGEFLVTNAYKEEFGVAIAVWLSIVQRLVCANSILSKNRNETRSQVEGFDAKKYLSMCEKDALKSLGNFFKATIASKKEALRDEDCKLLDKIIATIQVLVRGVVYVHDLDKKNNAEPEFDVLISEIDTDKVKQLVEMGFSQSDAVDALLQHSSVPEAAEFLLSMQNAPSGSGASLRRSGGYISARSSRRIATEVQPAIPATPGTDDNSAGTSQENQVQQTTGEGEEPPVVALQEALQSLEPIDAETSPLQNAANEQSSALTLEQGPSATAQPEREEQTQRDEKMDTDEHAPSTSTEPSNTLKKTDDGELKDNFSFQDLKATKTADFKETINYICNEIVPDCLQLVEKDQMLMFSVAELLAVFVNDPVAKDWAQNVLVKQSLIAELEQLIDKFSAKSQPTEQDALVNRFASLLHMFCLLWQGFDNIKVYSLLQPNFYDKTAGILFSLIEEQHNLSSKLIPPVLLCLDMYEKEKRMDMRQQLLSKSVEQIQWSYWINDERYGTTDWRDYPPVCSAVLNRAFREGRSSVQLVVNDKNVVVDFVDMNQRLAEPSNVGAHSVSVFGRAKLKPDFDVEELFRSETHLNEGSDQQRRIILCLLELLKSSDPPISVALAYSSLSLLLRFVSLKGMAKTFVEAQGVETLIRLECRENMALIPTAVALILRACVDDDATLENAFEWMIRSVEAGLPVSLSDMSSRMMPYNRPRRHHKEWRRAMRLFAPMAARAPLLYTNIMKKNVELNNNELTLKTEQSPQEAPKSICSEESVKVLRSIVTNLVHELQSTDFSTTKHRVLRPAALLKLLSEVLRSYSSAAVILVDMALENRSVVSIIIEKFLLNASDQPDVAIASKAVLTNLIVCPLTTKATELLVNEVKTLLQRTLVQHNSDRSNKLCEKVSILARLVMLLRESVKVAVTNRLRDAKQPSQFMRYIHKKNLAVDFAKSIWLLPLQEKSANETITQILRMFENIARDLTTVIRTTTAPAAASNTVTTANAPSTTETDVVMAPVSGEDSTAQSEQQPAAGSNEQNTGPPAAAPDHPEQGGSQASENRPVQEESNASMADLSLAHDATAEFEHGVAHFEHAGGLDHIGPNMALYHAELIEDDSQDDGSDSSDSSSSDESGSAGSDGEGGGEMLDDEETSEGEGGGHQNAMEGIRRRQFHRQIV
ncbi:E3 ubiquitin-protein ligase [Ditylenchus destructor]|uniref:E3 ubiquitin-protein ligase n=1 Tax=Ditylenchus destructor TaxID=166010 RepID=A0AAD4N2F3_9BILA|nr:E3 ubiquitin-protein ligase [Ditylenchus destructor]